MKLKEWLALNRPFMSCDFTVRLFGEKHNDMILETTVSWNVCERVFGDYKFCHLSIGEYPKSNLPCFVLSIEEDEK